MSRDDHRPSSAMDLWLASALAVLSSLIATPAFAAPPADDATVWLSNAEIHVGDGRVIEHGSVEIRSGKIVSVRAQGDAPSSGQVVDLAGQRVTPGLIAAHTPLGLLEIDGEASTRDDSRDDPHPVHAAFDAADALHLASPLVAVAAIDGVTSAAVTPAGGLFSGQALWLDLGPTASASLARREIAVVAHAGQTIAGSRGATLEALREVLFDARFYAARKGAHDRRQVRDLAAHPLDLEALDPVVRAQIPLVVEAHAASDIRALIELAREFGLRLVVVGGASAWQVADELAAAKVPIIVQPSDNLPSDFEHIAARMDSAAMLHAAGVEVGIAMLGEATNVRNVTQEAGLAIAHGLDPEVALQAVTLTLARAYGMAADYGSIEAGKLANLVVWDGDPFELSSQPVAVYIHGRAIRLSSRQTELRDRYRDLRRFRRPAAPNNAAAGPRPSPARD